MLALLGFLLQAALRCVRYVPFCRFSLRHAPSGEDSESSDDATLAMYPLVGPAPHAQRSINNEQRVLSDAPSGLFSSPQPAASRKSAAGFFLQFPSEVSLEKRPFRSISRTADFGRLVDTPSRGQG